MSTKIEDVARLLWHRFAPDYSLDFEEETHKAEYLDAARAVIEAMREPTDAMMAVQDTVVYLRDMWPAMIDAALSEKEPTP